MFKWFPSFGAGEVLHLVQQFVFDFLEVADVVVHMDECAMGLRGCSDDHRFDDSIITVIIIVVILKKFRLFIINLSVSQQICLLRIRIGF